MFYKCELTLQAKERLLVVSELDLMVGVLTGSKVESELGVNQNERKGKGSRYFC